MGAPPPTQQSRLQKNLREISTVRQPGPDRMLSLTGGRIASPTDRGILTLRDMQDDAFMIESPSRIVLQKKKSIVPCCPQVMTVSSKAPLATSSDRRRSTEHFW